MANGYTGKILRVNLTTKQTGTIDTAKYEEFGGGYGMGAAIFWGSSFIFIKLGLENGGSPIAGSLLAYLGASIAIIPSLLNRENKKEKSWSKGRPTRTQSSEPTRTKDR
jgi:hypothetical protein